MKGRTFRRGVALFLLAGVVVALTGCNTVAGFGEDISSSARAVQRVL